MVCLVNQRHTLIAGAVLAALASAAAGGAIVSRDTKPCRGCQAYIPALPRPPLTPYASATQSVVPRPTASRTPIPEEPTAPATPTAPGGTASPTAPGGTASPQRALRIGGLRCIGELEFVRIDNTSESPVALDGWRVRSLEGDQWFHLPDRPLAAGASLFVDSGPGPTPIDGDRVRWTRGYIWNNAGDEAELVGPSGTVAHRRECPPED